MNSEHVIPFDSSRRDPRINPVAMPPAPLPHVPPPTREGASEPSHLGNLGQLALSGDYDPQTEEQMRTLDAAEALHRLVEANGLQEIHRLLKLIAIGRGERLG